MFITEVDLSLAGLLIWTDSIWIQQFSSIHFRIQIQICKVTESRSNADPDMDLDLL
jgi:hypothetical protein